MKIAYIVSSSFSGSTLLAMILNAHPRIGTISEVNMTRSIGQDPDFECSCGEPIRQCPFFLDLRKMLADRGIQFSVDDMDMELSLHKNWQINQLLSAKLPRIQSSFLEDARDHIMDAIPSVRTRKRVMYERIDALMDSILELQNADIFLDGNKSPYRMRFLSKRHDVRAIYLFKNGVAGAYSFIKNTEKPSARIAVAAASHRWFKEQITISRSLKYLDPSHVLQLSYSDLCADAPAAVRAICNLLEIEYVPLDNYADVPHHVVGNRMRLGNIAEIKERTDWKEKFTAADIETYRSIYSKYVPAIRAVNPSLLDHIWH